MNFNIGLLTTAPGTYNNRIYKKQKYDKTLLKRHKTKPQNNTKLSLFTNDYDKTTYACSKNLEGTNLGIRHFNP